MRIINPEGDHSSTSAKDNGTEMFKSVVSSENGAIYLAENEGKYIGVASVYLIPQVRKGEFCAEIEEIYIEEEFWGTGVSALLLDEVSKWAKSKSAVTLRLETHNDLKRAQRFYEKSGFELYGSAYQKKI